MPSILGVYKKETDRAEVELEMRGTKIDKVNVIRPGSRYSYPICVVTDLAGYGRGAVLAATSELGSITSVGVIDGGELYIDPQVTIVEGKGKYISTTDDIGRLKSFTVLDPGRKISPDLANNPELKITTRAVIHDVTGNFQYGETVYQGLPSNRLFEAKVSGWDPDTQIVTMDEMEGVLRAGEVLYVDNSRNTGAYGTVICEGQADLNCIVDGVSSPLGTFLDDSSKISTRYAVLQDSYYFQWFSYVISAPIQQSKYDTMVKNTIHPAGFIMFSDLTVHDIMEKDYSVQEVEFYP